MLNLPHLYIYIYIYITKTFKTPTIFHVSIILKKLKLKFKPTQKRNKPKKRNKPSLPSHDALPDALPFPPSHLNTQRTPSSDHWYPSSDNRFLVPQITDLPQTIDLLPQTTDLPQTTHIHHIQPRNGALFAAGLIKPMATDPTIPISTLLSFHSSSEQKRSPLWPINYVGRQYIQPSPSRPAQR